MITSQKLQDTVAELELREMIRKARIEQDKKLLRYCLIATLLVSPILGLVIWGNLEAKACAGRIECQF